MNFINHKTHKGMIKKNYGRAKRFHLCINFGIDSILINYKILNR